MKTVVITGAAGGIGSACVGVFAELGATVIGVDVAPASDATEHLVLDLSRSDCGQALLEHLDGRPVDVLVNNAAVGFATAADAVTSDEFDSLIAVNLRAPFLLASALHPTLRQQRGSVVNVSSVHALATSAPSSVYAAAKGGLLALTRSLAVEWAPEVRVNCVVPGAVDTKMLSDGLVRADADVESLGAAHPLGRVGRAEEIADAVVFLATNEFTTGASLVVDGGATARLSTE
ncbi:MAG: SDR family oxidoreductase [Acidimicrobiia bacterium]